MYEIANIVKYMRKHYNFRTEKKIGKMEEGPLLLYITEQEWAMLI